ncbi:Uncharacterised protein [Bordetella pertussis]|nr:Uncharacterised protein [Bordetella pertussis]
MLNGCTLLIVKGAARNAVTRAAQPSTEAWL